MTCGFPSDRVAVATREAFAPFPAFGVALVSGGQATAQASAHALVVPESAWNRYSVRPFELTRIFPRLVFATRTVAGFAFVASYGVADALAELTPP
jgi:hypothetical protein